MTVLDRENPSVEADYTFVHFSLRHPDMQTKSIYVYGSFNNFALNVLNKMSYNSKSNTYELTMKLKQGFYNYKYVMKNEEGDIDLNTISGNFHFTENNYLILVYYRNFGDIYDSVIGVGSANSRSITN